MSQHEIAILAGGCFWCMVEPFDTRPGVIRVTSGYTGGHKENPTYEEVCSGTTGHTEAVEIEFDPSLISYEEILDTYWSSMDPTDAGGQFLDRGSSYRPEIFYTTKEQKEIAEKSKEALQNSGRFDKPIIVPITKASTFYPAEDYHQDFYRKNPERYQLSEQASGRSEFIRKHLEK